MKTFIIYRLLNEVIDVWDDQYVISSVEVIIINTVQEA